MIPGEIFAASGEIVLNKDSATLSRFVANKGAVQAGMRQSMPSASIDICAAVSVIVPSFAWGHTKRPFSRRFAKRTSPRPSK